MSDTTEKARYSAHVRSIIAGRVFGVPHQSTIDTAPNPQPGLQSEQTGSPPQIKSSKRKTLADSTNDDTDAKRPKLDDPGNNEPADDSSLPAIVLDDLDTVISKFKQNLRKMKVLLDGGRFSDVEELAQEAPRFSELLRKQSRVQIELMKKNLQKKNEMEEKMNEMEEKRKEMEEKMSELEEKRKEMEEESKEKDTEQEKVRIKLFYFLQHIRSGDKLLTFDLRPFMLSAPN